MPSLSQVVEFKKFSGYFKEKLRRVLPGKRIMKIKQWTKMQYRQHRRELLGEEI